LAVTRRRRERGGVDELNRRCRHGSVDERDEPCYDLERALSQVGGVAWRSERRRRGVEHCGVQSLTRRPCVPSAWWAAARWNVRSTPNVRVLEVSPAP
jgi:hypothetical protein